MALAPIAVLADAALLLIYLLGWAVTLGLLYAWNATFHHIFQGIARALSFTVNTHLGYKHTFHLGGWASTIDHAAQELFSAWAVGCEIMVGAFWHALAYLFRETVHAISRSSQATLDLGHYIVHDFVPARIHADLSPLWNRANKTAAAAAALAGGLAAIRHETRTHHHAQTQTNATTKARVTHAEHATAHTAAVATTTAGTVAHHGHVITSVLDVPSLPVPFGRTIAQIKKRIGLLEAGVGATAVALTIANVLGIPNPRCLSRGPLGRVARALCGIPTRFLNDLLGLIADFLILENVCTVLPWLEAAASDIGTPLVAGLTEIGAGLCKGSHAPAPLVGPMPSIPFLIFGVPVVEV